MSEHRSRNLPWKDIVHFHKEIATRAEQSFFSIYAKDAQAERWSGMSHEIGDVTGPWTVAEGAFVSNSFLQAVNQKQHESLFLGGPCYLAWERSMRGKWQPHWRPLLYREVRLGANSDGYEIIPEQGSWNLSPLIFSLFDRMSVDVGDSPDEFTGELIESATRRAEAESKPISNCLFEALFSIVPDIESDLTKHHESSDAPELPSPWILFAPASRFSALTRNLIKDYGRLETILNKDSSVLGGLRVLDDQISKLERPEIEILPLLPLNDSQRSAVEAILAQNPLTVISGPPGCGKSQVVVATLLNAWARGQTVLFASNNNKAVDVVRERLERFESEFPIAVRAGNKARNNIQEVLRRTINMVASAGRDGSSGDGRKDDRRSSLTAQIHELQNSLETQLPQRIDQGRSAALRAYTQYRDRLAEIETKELQQLSQIKEIDPNRKDDTLEDIKIAVLETKTWFGRIDHYKRLISEDKRKASEIVSNISDLERRRERCVEEIGLNAKDGGDWNWLISGPSPELLTDWETRFRDLIVTPIEQSLSSVEWDPEFDFWSSSEEAEVWSDRAREYAEGVRKVTAELTPLIAKLQSISQKHEEERSNLKSIGVAEDVSISSDTLASWIDAYAEMATREPGGFDFLPWSALKGLDRRLARLETAIKPAFSLEIWRKIGTLNAEGREKLAPIIEQTKKWLELKIKWEKAQEKTSEVEHVFGELRATAGSLKIPKIPTSNDIEEWLTVAVYCDERAQLSSKASDAWLKRVEKEFSENKLRNIATEWDTVGSGVPVREAWRRGQGSEFVSAMSSLQNYPNKESVVNARTALYGGSLNRLVETWKNAGDLEQQIRSCRTDIDQITDASERFTDWLTETPGRNCVVDDNLADWPDENSCGETVRSYEVWIEAREEFLNKTLPELEKTAEQELTWAVEKLEQAINLLPLESVKIDAMEKFAAISDDPATDWPLEELNGVFDEFRPDRILAQIAHLESELEHGSFEDAKFQWLDRLAQDDDAIRAVDSLEKSINRHRGAVPDGDYGLFKDALRAVPIWITTAQAPQAIPMEPELFDIVIIDEASQCTLTNLLPLMYRGKSLAVIGDDQQLPAIPTIGELEEINLATKFSIEGSLDIIGHASNDVYKAAADALPRRRADVVFLEEHFRSHPQIIGFSNRHIYRQRLELRKNPDWGNRLPVASGVHRISVSGSVRRGDGGRSWINQPEADKVFDLILQLREGDARGLSLGVVTPFAAQKEYLWGKLEQAQMMSEVLVDTAYGFQGDERDVMIFSPVVSKGITPSAARWVESPPNLINVALTRAREALFVVADFDCCKQQDGILRKLAKYVDDVQLLRDTSPAELELFSWMIVEGLVPQVHPKIGDIEVDLALDGENGIKLAIEVDGKEFHEDRQQQDKARDAFLKAQGYEVLRTPARAVMETPFEVLHEIRELIGT